MDEKLKLEGQKLESRLKLENELLANPLVTDYFSTNFGENSVKVIRAAMDEMTDDAIAARCKLKVAEVRAILNKLYNYKLAEYKRIKDRDTGWFSYIWKIDVSNVLSVIQVQIKLKITELNDKVEKMNSNLLYYCPKCSRTNLIHFDLAMDLSFRCPHCENKLIEKEIKEKVEYQSELNDLKNKHLILIEDIKKFEEMRKIEEENLKMMQAQVIEQTMIQSVSEEGRSEKGRASVQKIISKKSTGKIKSSLKKQFCKKPSKLKSKLNKSNKTNKSFKSIKSSKTKPVKKTVKVKQNKPKPKLNKKFKVKNKRIKR